MANAPLVEEELGQFNNLVDKLKKKPPEGLGPVKLFELFLIALAAT